MKKNITNALVGRLKPAEKEYEVRDTDLKGLVLRVKPSGKMIYTLVYKRGKRITLGRADVITPFQARELAKTALADHYKGEDPIEKKRQVKAESYLQFLKDTYSPWLALNVSYAEATLETLIKAFPELHSLRLDEITSGVIEKWRLRRLKDGIRPSTINRQMNDLRACLNRAINIWGLIEANPFEKVKPCKIDTSPKVRYLTKAEEAKLYKALDERETAMKAARAKANEWRRERGYKLYADTSNQFYADYLKPAVLISLHTGLRRGELFGLKWQDVDFEQKHLTVIAETTKTRKTRHVPLNEEALSVLKKWKDQPGVKSQFVFHGKDGQPFHDVETSWAGVLNKAEIENFRWHDLRHTFASKLVMAGVDLNTVRELLGHTDYKMTLRYAHLAPEHKSAAVSKLVAMAVQV